MTKVDDFPWGRVVKKHSVGEYEVIEYISGPGWHDEGSTQFHAESTSCSYESLEEALLDCICEKFNPGQRDVLQYVCRVIGM